MAKKRRSHPRATELTALLEITRDLPGFTFVGFDSSGDPPAAEVTDLPFDPRSAAGGLFGVRAPRRWDAVAVTITGTARRVESTDELGDVTAGMVVTRNAELASFIDIGERCDSGIHNEEHLVHAEPDGMLVDALHRVLGLPSPGEPPDPSEMMMSIWLDDVLTILFDDRQVTWAQMARIHPAVESTAHSPSMTPPSDEMIIEAIERSRPHVDWRRIHQRAVQTREPTARLTPREIRWMDPTMFARWTLSLLPTVEGVALKLSDLGCSYEAERLVSLDSRIRSLSPPISGAA